MQAVDLTLTVDRPMPGAGTQILDTGKLSDRAYAEVNEAFGAA